jgi:3-dehydroquinate synthase
VFRDRHQDMRTLNVDLADRSYPIHIGAGLLGQTDLITTHLPQKRAVVITNETVAPLYLDALSRALGERDVSVVAVVIPDGEAHKNWQTLNTIFDALLEHRCERRTAIVALGGGVVGDIAGFAAAVYQRGVPFVQVPTTLLAQVDSAVGGKTAINHALGKNMIGAFYQPRVVLADTDTLHTLPARELAAGLAEVIKYGLIRDRPFFDWLEANLDRLLAREPAALAHAIEQSCRNKAEMVGLDERETGVRALLNFGHTFGHAIEAGTGFGTWLHGEAVAAGMVLAAQLSQRLGRLGADDVSRTVKLLARAGLPVQAPDLGLERYLDLMGHDKKVEGGRLKFVLLDDIGSAFMGEAPQPALADLLDRPAGHA